MTGPEHYRRAEELAAQAHRLLGQGDGQATAGIWAAVAQTPAVLALAAATAGRRPGWGRSSTAAAVARPCPGRPAQAGQVTGPRPPSAPAGRNTRSVPRPGAERSHLPGSPIRRDEGPF